MTTTAADLLRPESFAPRHIGPSDAEQLEMLKLLGYDSLDAFIDAGANWISLHVEAMPHLQRSVNLLRKRGVRAGAVLNPATSILALDEILPELDYVLVMSVNPGFGGQSFLPRSLEKIRRLATMIRERGLSVQIEVDGGVDLTNVRSLVEAGAEVLVAGSAVFGKGDAEAAARALIQAAA